jgi:hypothetical protein
LLPLGQLRRDADRDLVRIVADERQAERAADLFYQSVRNPRRA